MSTAKITLSAFYTWFSTDTKPNDLFKNLVLPEGIEKDTLVGNILMRGGEFEVMYSDPDFMQSLIGIWSKKWYRTFDKWIKALNIEYSPLENYDRMEDWTDTRNKKDSSSDGSTGSVGMTGNITDSGSTSHTGSVTDSGTIENKVSAFDSSEYQPSDQTTTGNTQSTSESTTSSNNRGTTENTTTSSNLTHSGEEHEGNTHKGRIHGNVGVTTSQQMLEAELKLAEWNLYEHITDLFLSEFVIPIYS